MKKLIIIITLGINTMLFSLDASSYPNGADKGISNSCGIVLSYKTNSTKKSEIASGCKECIINTPSQHDRSNELLNNMIILCIDHYLDNKTK